MPKVVSSISKNKGKGKKGASSEFVGQETAITLRCILDGDRSSKSFMVSVPLTANVWDLMLAIKDKNSHDFDFIGARRLGLWKVLIPLPQDDIKESVEEEEQVNMGDSRVNLDEIPKKEKKLLRATSKKVSKVGDSRVYIDEIPKEEKKLLKFLKKKVSVIFGSQTDDNMIHAVFKLPPKAQKRD
ncbi:hypothetical protein EC991_004873 [Linnemannia zychae]|nr:hypothetical protein EC991_004873 [Linnemannia zychae]